MEKGDEEMTVKELKHKLDYLYGIIDKATKFTLLSNTLGYGFEIPKYRIRKSAIQNYIDKGFVVEENDTTYKVYTGKIYYDSREVKS